MFNCNNLQYLHTVSLTLWLPCPSLVAHAISVQQSAWCTCGLRQIAPFNVDIEKQGEQCIATRKRMHVVSRYTSVAHVSKLL